VSPVNQYKRVEKKLSNKIIKRLKAAGNAISLLFKNIVTIGKQRFTVMFIPHSEKKIFNFRISVFSLIFFCILLTGVLIAFFLSSTYFSGLSRLLSTKSERLEKAESSLEVMRDEIAELRKVARSFESALKNTLSILEVKESKNPQVDLQMGEFNSFFGVVEQEEGVLKELSELQSLNSLLNDSIGSLQKITELLVSHGELLVELPTLWPLKGVRGRITNYFGPAEHPFTKNWYLHKGVDLAYRIGTPVVATANGKVVEKKFEPMGFGHYIVIRHKYGFYTKYAHLRTVTVREGEEVTQGQVIGTLGNTGLSTGPHLHYEVRIGSQVVDPMRYLSIKSGLKTASIK